MKIMKSEKGKDNSKSDSKKSLADSSEQKILFMDGLLWEFFLFLLAIYVLMSILFQFLFSLDPDLVRLLRWVDNGICIIFIIDFVYKFSKAESKWAYLKFGWIDLLGSIPNIDILRWGRLFHLFRFLRIIRTIRSMRVIFQFLIKNPVRSIFLNSAIFCFFLVIIGSIAILELESNQPHSNIKEPADALWWSFVTMTTVGYGDYFPITAIGRIIAILLMISGIGLFGLFTAHVSSFLNQSNFIVTDAKKKQELFYEQGIISKIDALTEKVEDLNRSVGELKEKEKSR